MARRRILRGQVFDYDQIDRAEIELDELPPDTEVVAEDVRQEPWAKDTRLKHVREWMERIHHELSRRGRTNRAAHYRHGHTATARAGDTARAGNTARARARARARAQAQESPWLLNVYGYPHRVIPVAVAR